MSNYSARKIHTFTVSMSNTPGEIHKIYQCLREGNISIIASSAAISGFSNGYSVFCTQENAGARSLLQKGGWNFTEGYTCCVEGENTPGAYEEVLRKIADNGINLNSTTAQGCGDRFSATFFVEDSAVQKLCSALNC